MRLRDLSIRRKLTVGTVLVSAGALCVAMLASFAIQIHLARRAVARDLTALAEVVAANAVGPLAFKDAAAAKTLLSALRARPEIIGARLRDATGAIAGTFQAGPDGTVFRAPDAGNSMRIDGFYIYIAAPVWHEGERLGTLELTTNIRGWLGQYVAIVGGAFIVVLVGSLLVALLLADRWQHAFTRPLLSLAGTARQVATSNDYTLRTPDLGSDEIGQLALAFNRMLAEVHARDTALRETQQQLSEQVDALRREIAERERAEAELAKTHRELIDASRRAGQAEVATSVLHNVGNVLNSVGVSASIAADRLRAARLGNVGLAGKLLAQHREELGTFFRHDPKGSLLLDYLPQLSQHLQEERDAVLLELEVVLKNIEHIKEIVAVQQSYARVGGVREIVRPVEIMEHALALNGESLARHGVTVVRRYQDVPAFSVDQHQVLQILVNLISNAKNALKATLPDTERTLTVTVESQDGWLRLIVADTGVGISADNLGRIFQHGFTTRLDGHGFGLHSGALAAQNLGGRLIAASDGPGRGAVFTVELPMAGGGA